MLNLFFNFYNFFATKIENILFKKKNFKINNFLLKRGYEIIKLKNKLNIDFKNKKTISKNKYFKIYVLTKKDLEKIIFNLFKKNNLKEILEKKLGFKFNVNFILAYKTYNVSLKDQNGGWYANHWHRDKTFSKNVIKLIIPLHQIGSIDGGIQIYDKNISQQRINKTKKKNCFIFKGMENDLLIFNPNECFHKAGNPKSKPRSQLMLQLNPSYDWTKDKKLYEKQFRLEPKFPLIKYMFLKKEKI
jgi:hypothetical protein